MSNMFEQAIVDATALKEAAIRNAEQTIIEKYSEDIKEAVTHLLEQPDPAMGMLDDDPAMAAPMGAEGAFPPQDIPPSEFGQQAPLAATEGEDLCPCPEEEEVIEIDFDQLASQIEAEGPEGMDAGEMAGREGFAEDELEEEPMMNIAESVLKNLLNEEEFQLDESDLSSLFEDDDYELEEDYDSADRTPSDTPDDRKKPLEEIGDGNANDALQDRTAHTRVSSSGALSSSNAPMTKARAKSDKDTAAFKKAQATKDKSGREAAANASGQTAQPPPKAKPLKNGTVGEQLQKYKEANTQLHEQNTQYKNIILQMKERLDGVNLSNAKLLFTNRTLNSVSLNERQKRKIVEAISNASTLEETKTIFETLQSAVAGSSSDKKTPKSLNEVVSRRSSAFLPRKEVKNSDPQLDRMQKLAGIKK